MERNGTMRWQGIKVHVVAISMLVALAAFLGAQWVYNSLNFQQPLNRELDNNKLIADYQIKENTGVYTISVTLHDTGDLMHTYRQIDDRVHAIIGDRPYVIELVDRRNKRLNDVYNHGQFAIYEAMAVGNFREMADSLNQYANAADLASKVYIDSDNIYWQMKDGDYYLYAVLSRGKWPVNVPLGTGPERGAADGI
ncbi:hypothetical protein [Desulfoscipio sp. XC116]|uniref:hypothetical protein n=1 Tax=Desulfoscipio sp. XC116 TaxID=3144975 RepID=UPI00325C2186